MPSDSCAPKQASPRTAAEVLTGTCFCGAVEVRATGAPVEMGYCHCASCRAYSGAPFVTYTLYQTDQVSVGRGGDLLGLFNKSGTSARRFCTRCGGHVMTEHSGLGFTDIHASALPGVAFAPVWHLDCAEAMLSIRDGLSRLADFPADAGGSGARVLE